MIFEAYMALSYYLSLNWECVLKFQTTPFKFVTGRRWRARF